MKPVEFKEQNCVYAEGQSQYLPLPGHKTKNGTIISRWKFSFWERLKVLFSGKIWFHVLTFNKPLQPQYPTLECPFGKDGKLLPEAVQ